MIESTADVPGCLACDLTYGREALPGGLIHGTAHWHVEHCVGPLGVGTLIVKPKRHVTRVSMLNLGESSELGVVLQSSAAVIDEILSPDQVYTCLWSHAGGQPVHIHYVVQPISSQLMHDQGTYGPRLLVQMFDARISPDPELIASFADAARLSFSARASTA